MNFLQSSFGRPYAMSLNPRQFGVAVIFTTAAVALGWLLIPWLGIVGAYFPVLVSVSATTWISGLWPSLLSQILGSALTLFFTARTAGAAISKTDLYAVLLFLVIAELIMFLLLNIRLNHYLQQTKAYLEMIAQSTHDSLWEWDFATNYVWRGGRVAETFSCEAEEVKPEVDWGLKRIHPADVERVWTSLRRSVDGRDNHWSSEYRLRRNDGSYATVSDHGFIIRNKKGVAVRMFGGMADISAQRNAEEHLIHSVSHDVLTGLPNREFLLDQLDRLLKKRRYNNDGLIAVLFIDIDRFKTVNNSLGHAGGNQLLSAIAARLARCLRENDIAARSGGDEFIVLLGRVETSAEAVHIVERIQQSLAAPFDINEQAVRISASIGVSFAESTQAEEAVRQADLAMYQAKAHGRARFQIFEPSLESRARYTLQTETELRHSFHDGSLQLYFQPIVSLQDGRIFGFEALLRWQHPTRGLIKPSEILPIAEEAGLSAELGQWVLRNACACLSRWKQSKFVPTSLVMSFNLSGKELTRLTLVNEVRELLNNTGLDGGSLVIELTETTIMESDTATVQKLEHLRNLGVSVALDDFGKGHSSLGRLQDFPISMLKVDSLFVKRIGTDKPQILDAILALAHELQLEIVAEGVETLSQLRYLKERGSALAQGLFFSEALSEERAFQLLKSEQLWDVYSADQLDEELRKGFAVGQN
ncbi:MAG: putative bifunctional diguanylate cyclase/phosphodiesterase [Bryobacteraceae bacterium]